MRRTFVLLVWFRITLTTFSARITAIHLYLSKLYLKYYWFHFFPDTVYMWVMPGRTLYYSRYPLPRVSICYAPPLIGGTLSDASVWRLTTHLQAWAEAYQSGRPPTVRYFHSRLNRQQNFLSYPANNRQTDKRRINHTVLVEVIISNFYMCEGLWFGVFVVVLMY